MQVQQSTIGAFGGCACIPVCYWSLCWYSRILKEHSKGLVGRAEYHRSAREVVLVQHSTIRALRRLCWYSRVLKEHSRGCVGTEDYSGSAGEALLVQKSTTGALVRLCWYSRVL